MGITRTNMIDDDGTGTTGTIINNAWKQELYNQIDALTPTGWTPYAPVWSGSGGTLPTVGNTELYGRYLVSGRRVDVAIMMRLGTTAVVGSSTYWTLTLPLPMIRFTTAYQETAFLCGVMDPGSAIKGGMTAYGLGASLVYAASAGGLWSPTVPFAWGTNALITIRGTYETP